MTPERLSKLETLASESCFAFDPEQARELIAEVKRLQSELAALKEFNKKLIEGNENINREKNEAVERAERFNLQFRDAKLELAALKTLANLSPDYCLSCGGDGGHLEGCQGATGLMSVLTELNEANARISYLTIANEKLHKELSALKTPHCCDDCEHFGALKFCNELKMKVYSPASLWLCGHFKAKGNQ